MKVSSTVICAIRGECEPLHAAQSIHRVICNLEPAQRFTGENVFGGVFEPRIIISGVQSASPKVGNKPAVQAKPKEQSGCTLVGTVRGTKLWAGDCVGVELHRGTTETTRPIRRNESGPGGAGFARGRSLPCTQIQS